MAAPVVTLVPYDPTWPDLFEAEATRIERNVHDLLIRLEHVGSTAVPRIAARPVIDILAGRPPKTPATPYIAALRQLGYEHMGTAGIPGREFFRRGEPRSHHLHLVSWTTAFWRDQLLFRDYLRTHEAVAREYETLKYDLAVTLPDRKLYADAKSPFIRRVLREARAL